MKQFKIFSYLLAASLTAGLLGCKPAQKVEQAASEVESLETVKMCEPGLFRWMCRPTSTIFFAVKIDSGYCFYVSEYKGKSPDEKPKYVGDLYRDERYTISFPTAAPKKVERKHLVTLMSKDMDNNAADPKDVKGRFLEVLKGELENADKTPGKVNLSAKYATKVMDGYIEALAMWMGDAMRNSPQAAGGSCPAPRALVGAK